MVLVLHSSQFEPVGRVLRSKGLHSANAKGMTYRSIDYSDEE